MCQIKVCGDETATQYRFVCGVFCIPTIGNTSLVGHCNGCNKFDFNNIILKIVYCYTILKFNLFYNIYSNSYFRFVLIQK